MSLSGKQITEWSRRGDPVRAWYSYEMVRESLTRGRLSGMSYAIYPQGSYANKTNIVADSDVDMVIALRSAFYPEKRELSDQELIEYSNYYGQADTTWHEFREVVVDALRSAYFVHEGSKCVKVLRSNVVRLPADVLIALDHRYYTSFPSFAAQAYADGVQFYRSGGEKIINYPKRHIRACARKNAQTAGKFRCVVRVAKNARNALIADDDTRVIAGTAPSYYLESLFWNVPDSYYAGELEQAYRQAVGWLGEHTARLPLLDLPNGMGRILGSTRDTSWNHSDARTIIEAMYRQLRS